MTLLHAYFQLQLRYRTGTARIVDINIKMLNVLSLCKYIR